MKKAFVLLCCGALAPVAFGDYVERARVVESSPIVETVFETEEVCRYRSKRRGESGNAPGEASNIERKVIGGVVGGLAGSAIGKGSGRDAAAGVGAVIGSEIGDGDGITEGELIGGIAGGIIGNQLGKGSGKTAGTAAGALIGAIVGDELQNGGAAKDERGSQHRSAGKIRVCTLEEREKKVITGYNVVFEYNGLRSSGKLPYRPTDYVDVNVRLDLLENRTGFSAE
ncbi:MAG: glycine zipper 2TM domain-containing protein [Gammaproteobacteria bacterium]